MQKISFGDIPANYQLMKNEISNETINFIYSKFIFKYLSLNTQNANEIEPYLLDYFKSVKFITYHFYKNNQNKTEEINSSIICIENECLIIETPNITSIKKILNKLKETRSVLNFSFNSATKTKEEEILYDEMNSFISYFEINNAFFTMTINSISGFLIRRFFYPTEYYQDSSFFIYNQPDKQKEIILKSKLYKTLFLNSNIVTINELYNTIEEIKNLSIYHKNALNNYQHFDKSDFIFLRNLHSNEKVTLYLAIHIKTLYIFNVKIASSNYQESNEFKNEKEFCENCSHRCFIRFYGFLT